MGLGPLTETRKFPWDEDELRSEDLEKRIKFDRDMVRTVKGIWDELIDIINNYLADEIHDMKIDAPVAGDDGFVLYYDHGNLKFDWKASAAGVHAGTHITGAGDEIDGDKLDIDFTPTTYTPNVTPPECDNVDNLTAHLKGIDLMLFSGIHHGDLAGLGDDDHTQYIRHNLSTAANDFLVGSGANTFIKKTLAETGAILEGDIDHGNIQGLADDDHAQYHNDARGDARYALLAHKDRHDPEDGADKLDCAAAGEIVGVAAAAEGSAHEFARADHTHQVQHSIADNHIVTVDGTANQPVNTDYAAWTASGLEGRNKAQMLTFLNVADGADVTGSNAPQAHAASHQNGGADELNHDNLAGFVTNEHLNGKVAILDERALGDITPANLDGKTAKFSFTDDITGSPNTWDGVLTVKGWDMAYRAWQLISNAGNDANNKHLFFRTGQDATWDSIRKIWDDGNDGTGSGLDADQLDGQEGAWYTPLTSHNDHKDRHDPEDGADKLDCAAAGEIIGVVAAAEGTAHSFARSDHTHQIQHSIADNHVLTVDDADAADNDYAKFTASGLEGRSYSEVMSDLSGQAGADFSMNTHKITGVVDPTANQDAATKKYVDDNAGGGGSCDIATGTYTGDGSVDQAISGLGFQPKFVKIWESSPVIVEAVDQMARPWTIYHTNGGLSFTNAREIVTFDADGFTVSDHGSDEHPNRDDAVYYYLALG